jgi:PAS domain S-box-containing protein
MGWEARQVKSNCDPADVISADSPMPPSPLLKTPAAELNAELLILNTITEGLCGLDAGGNATVCNAALLKMTGYCTDELIGSNLHELLHHNRPQDAWHASEECAFRKASYTCQPIHVVGELLLRKDGTSFLAEYLRDSWKAIHELLEPYRNAIQHAGAALAHSVIANKHAGKIWFETEMGCGTTFFINRSIGPASAGKEI